LGLDQGWGIWALLLAAVILWGHVLILALEFLLLPWVNRADPAPRASALQHLKAWWTEARACSQVFGWQQPFASNSIPDHWPARSERRRGLLLVHGFCCNRGLWNTWLKRLREAEVPFVAVTMEPAFGSIDSYVPQLEAAVAELERRTGMAPLLVGHSMGGLAIRAWWRVHGRIDRVQQVLTLGTPHAGTFMARFSQAFNARQMRLGSAWLEALAAQETAEMRARFRCYYSHTDNIVCPASSAALPDAEHVHLAGTGHIRLLFDDAVFADVTQRLKPSA
jgi:triacylglycerol lipase